MKHRVFDLAKRALGLLLAVLLLLPMAAPVWAAEGADTVCIGSVEQLLELAERCALDSWSKGKTVRLTADISLAGLEYRPIPTFAGTFDGGGHTINGINLSSGVVPAGLFGTLQEGAVVKDLQVSGVVAPSGKDHQVGGIAGINAGTIERCRFSGKLAGGDAVGGIAGTNALTGHIRDCTAAGGITGKSRTGGIAGENLGTISRCQNESYVNTTSTDPGLDLTALDLQVTDSLFTLRTLDTVNIATDTGGIAGYSSGMVLGCINSGLVGYQHVGYNVGGIAGRSCGHIADCRNLGPVFGRKDVGGIVGQAEPYIVLDLSKDLLAVVRQELDRLEGLVDQAADHADDSTAQISAQLDAISQSVDTAAGHAQDLAGHLSDYAGSVVDEIDRGSDILAQALDQLADISQDATRLSRRITAALDRLEQAVRAMARVDASGVGDSLSNAADRLEQAGKLLEQGSRELADGLALLRQAVISQDEEQAQAALEQIRQGLSDAGAAADRLRDAIEDLIVSGSVGTPEELEALRSSLEELAGAMEQVRGGTELLLAAHSFDLEALREGLRSVSQGVSHGADAARSVLKALRSLRDTSSELESVGRQVRTALGKLADAVDGFTSAGKVGEDVFEGLSDLFDYLSRVDPIQIGHPDEAIHQSSDALYDTLHQLTDRMRQLDHTAATSEGALTGDIRAISAQAGLVMDTLIDAIYEVENYDPLDSVSDTSEEDVDRVTSGKVLRCTNEGAVSGDINVGGAAGAVAVEYELDPEDDLLSSDAPAYRRAYELKAILQKCVNLGTVTGRREDVGAICGHMDLGLAVQCEGYGSVSCENGDRVGGIAGYSVGSIWRCSAKCTLTGRNYVGGIVGSAEGGRSEGGVVRECCAFVQIPDCQQYAGAISGSDQGTFQNNCFVSDTLAGLNQISVSGRAEPVSYQQMVQMEELPAEMKRLTLRFWADGRMIRSRPFAYGASFDQSVFPDIPDGQDSFLTWDREELRDLRFDTDVTAVYSPYISALCSQQTRNDGRHILFAEGLFDDEDQFSASPVEVADQRPRALQTLLDRRQIQEQWTLTIPEDGQDVHTIRYLSPTGQVKHMELYALSQGRWVRLETEAAGSYLTAQVEGPSPQVAAVWRTSIWWVWPLAALLLAVVAVLTVSWRRYRALLAQAAGDGEPVPQESRAVQRRGRTAAIVLLVVAVAGGVVWFFVSGTADSMAAIHMLRQYVREPALEVELNAQVDAGGQRYDLDARLSRIEVDGRRITRVEQYGGAVYHCGGLACLEDGSAVAVGTDLSDYSTLLETVATLYKGERISVFSNSGEKIYSITARGDQAMPLLEDLFPGCTQYLSDLQTLDIDLVHRERDLSTLRLSAGVTLEEGTQLDFAIDMDIRTPKEQPELPAAVRQQLLSGSENASELLPLLKGWERCNAKDPLAAQLRFEANCGPLVKYDEISLCRTHTEGSAVTQISKNGRSLYQTGRALLDQWGEPWEGQGQIAQLPDLLYQLCVQGGLHGRGNSYTLELSSGEAEHLASLLLPELEELDIVFDGGQLSFHLSQDELDQVDFRLQGDVQVMEVTSAATVTGTLELSPADPDFSVPDGVRRAIKEGRG